MENSQQQNTLGISGIVLCKRFQQVPEGAQAAARAPKYVPLTGNDVEFIPAGDTRFARSERLFSYFEIYEPAGAGKVAAQTHFQVRVMDEKTGEVKMDTGLQDAASASPTGNNIVPVAGEIAIGKLTPGNYRLEVQASDSAGKNTGWREVSFVIQ